MLDNYTQVAYNKDVDKTCTKGVKMDIKSVRDYMNMSQKEFSEFCGININTLQNWEQGRTNSNTEDMVSEKVHLLPHQMDLSVEKPVQKQPMPQIQLEQASNHLLN